MWWPCLQKLCHLDGDVEGEGDDDLEDDDERPEGEEAVPPRLDRLVAQLVQEGRVPGVINMHNQGYSMEMRLYHQAKK